MKIRNLGVIAILAACLAVVQTAGSEAAADPPVQSDGSAQRDRRQVLLDDLFIQLKAARDEAGARAIENEIWQAWMVSGDPTIDRAMEEVMRLRRNYDFRGAIALLDRIVVEAPDYAEAWNQRATMHFMVEEFDAALVDIARTLALEPRHFGALSGRALIRMRHGAFPEALADLRAAVAVHPYLRERSMIPMLEPR